MPNYNGSITLIVVQVSDQSRATVDLGHTGRALFKIVNQGDIWGQLTKKLEYKDTPAITILTNINNSEFVGMQWEFFNDENKAVECYNKHLATLGHCPTMRPFNERVDRQHMGAVHR